MPRILLLLPSSTYRAADFIEAARGLGAELVIASDARQAMADTMGARSLTLDLSDPRAAAEAIVDHAERVALDAIVAVDDRGVVPAALAASELGLAHNPPEAVAATRDKARLRRTLAQTDVVQPAFVVVDPVADRVAAAVERVGLPCVIKPVGLSGSQGVIRVDTVEEARRATRRIQDIVACSEADPGSPLLVEEFVAGDEVAVEGLLRDGELEVLAVFDKPDPLNGPYFEETLYVTPSRLPDDLLAEIEATTAAACAGLGLVEGPVHAELRVNADATDVGTGDGRTSLLEVAARSIGGLCARSLRFGLGVSLEELILRHALGMDLETLKREPAASGVMMLPIPRAGKLAGVDGLDEAREVDGIVDGEITIPTGKEVQPLPDGDRYLGFLFARGETPEEVETALRAGHRCLRIDIRGGPDTDGGVEDVTAAATAS